MSSSAMMSKQGGQASTYAASCAPLSLDPGRNAAPARRGRWLVFSWCHVDIFVLLAYY